MNVTQLDLYSKLKIEINYNKEKTTTSLMLLDQSTLHVMLSILGCLYLGTPSEFGYHWVNFFFNIKMDAAPSTG